MNAFVQRTFLQVENILIQSKRFRGGKINIQRPRKPHYERALFNAVTRPIYPKRTAIDVCQEQQQLRKLELEAGLQKELHPYEAIQARELHGMFDSAKMILICQKNSMTAYEYFKFRVDCKKYDVKSAIYNRKVIRNAIQDTRFAAMIPLLTQTSYSCMLFSQEWNVGGMLKVFKKTPKMLLLAGALGDRYMSRAELEGYAELPDLTTTRAQFVTTLNLVGVQLTNHLQAHQSNLCQLLDAHANALKTGNNTSSENSN